MDRTRAIAASVLSVALLMATGGATRGAVASAPASVHDRFLAAVAPCAAQADASACAGRALEREAGALGARIEAMPSGRAGLPAWVSLAASLSATPARGDVAVPFAPLASTLEAFYREAGHAVTPALRSAVRAQSARLGARAAHEVSKILAAAIVSNRLAANATRGSGIEALLADPGRAMRIVGLADAPAGSVDPGLRAESARNRAIMARIDRSAMATAAVVMSQAIAAFDESAMLGEDDVDLPFVFVGGEGDTVHSENRLISIDMSGNDTYNNNAGGGLADIAGGSIAVDYGAGADRYEADRGAQGYGTGAPGILYDEGGTDTYLLRQFGQGAGVAGVGVLYDAGGGDDVYDSPGSQPIGTKAASLGGIGILLDEGGNDYVRQDALDGFAWGGAGTALMVNLGDGTDTYRADSHPQPPILCTEPPCPDDVFAGPIQVSAEVSGIAILYEEGGNDVYTCGAFVRQGCQGAAGAGSFALLWDRAGDDTYWMGQSFSEDFFDAFCGEPCEAIPSPVEHPIFPMGQGVGYETVCVPCHPQALGILYDEAGSDGYTAAEWAQGYGTFGGLGLLRDAGGGADSYTMQPPLSGMRADGQTWADGVIGFGIDD